MIKDLKDIHIGKMIWQSVQEKAMQESRICRFIPCSPEELQNTYNAQSIDTLQLLRWSKLLQYDFFRLYSQHLILFAPKNRIAYNRYPQAKNSLPKFRKNIYTQELIKFVLEQIQTGEKSIAKVIEEYNIPKTTLYKWIQKYPEINKYDQ